MPSDSPDHELDVSAETPALAPPAAGDLSAETPPARPRRRRAAKVTLATLIAGGIAAIAGVALAGSGSASAPAATLAKAPATTSTEAGAPATKAPAAGEIDPLAPLPKARARVVAPVAGEATDAPAAASAAGSASAEDDMSLPKPKGPASKGSGDSGGSPSVHNLRVDTATALPNGVALPPLEAPEAVLAVIRAGNTIARTPYKWGGGHGSFKDTGYDCSGSVTFALYAGGLIGGSATSGQLMSWGKPGKGRWITVYASGTHTFMEVAGIRFDTSGTRVTGSRWQNEFRPTAGFAVRHPAGL